jgi:hypothetical protein
VWDKAPRWLKAPPPVVPVIELSLDTIVLKQALKGKRWNAV